MKSEKSSARKFLVLPEFDLSQALCGQTDPEIFFPEKAGERKSRTVETAKKICSECTVRLDCLEWALKNDEKYGIWGGLTVQERYKLRGPRDAKGRGRKPLAIRTKKEES